MRQPRAVFLDFDGVILESLDVKTEAMASLFADHPQHVKEIVRYHVENAGVNRYEKFRHYYSTFLKKPLSDEEMARLDRSFSDLIWAKMTKVPFVPGALEFIKSWGLRLPLFVISAAPQREIDAAIKQRGLEPFLRSAHGSPTAKKDHLSRLLREQDLTASRCLFVGDGKADFDAAHDYGIPFVQRLTHHSPTPFGPCVAVMNDLHGLDKLWAVPGAVQSA